MPSIFSRKPWTKCCRDCSPSVRMSMPASSCSFSASMVASRLARASASPDDFQGAHSVLGSASHSGFGSEPAIVVGNSMSVSPGFLIGWTICHVLLVRYRQQRACPGDPRLAFCRSQDVDGRDKPTTVRFIGSIVPGSTDLDLFEVAAR